MADNFDAAAAVDRYLSGAAPTPETTLRASLQDAVGQNPDQAADWRRTAATIGVPIDTAQALPDWAKQQKALAGIDTSALAAMNPVTTSFLSDPTNAAIAHDDTENMGLIETLANSFRRGVPGLQQVLSATALRSNVGALEQFDAIAARIDAGEKPTSIRAADDPMGVAFMTPEQRAKFRASITTPIGGNIASVVQTQKERQAIPSPAVVDQVMKAETFKQAISAFMTDPVKFIASIGPESMVTNAPGLVAAIPAGMTGGPAAAAATLGTGSFITDYGSTIVEALTKAGVDVTKPEQVQAAVADPAIMNSVISQAIAHAAVVGTFDALSGGVASKLALPKGVATKLALKPVTRELANVAAQVPIQGALGAAGEAGGEIAAGQKLDPGNILAEFVGEAFTAPAEIASIATTQVRERIAEGRAAEAAAARIETLTKLVEASKLRERDPETFKAFVDQVAEGGDTPSELYINAEALANTLNQSGITMTELQALAPSVATQMQAENFVPGADLRIPVSELLAAPSEISATLVDHLRTSPEAMSRAEAGEFLKAQGEAIRTEVEAALSKREERDAFQASVNLARDHFKAELDLAGRFRPEVNEAYAQMLGNFYATQAQRAGMALPEFMQKYQLQVTGKTPARGQTLEQGASTIIGREDFLAMPADANGARSMDDFSDQTVARVEKAISAGQTVTLYADGKPQNIVAVSRGMMQDDKGQRWGLLMLASDTNGSNRIELGAAPSSSSATVGRASAPTAPVARHPRATLSFGEDITQAPSVIALLEGADLSSFLHESGHFFLEVQADLAARIQGKIADGDTVTAGERQVVDDMNTALKSFGIEGSPTETPLAQWQNMTLEEKRDHHEAFARSFEQYAMEGKAPSQALAGVFQRFRAWLVSVYKTLASLNVKLTDDVRAVMNRMLATDEAIQQAQDARNMGPLFESAERAGMTPEEYADYQALGQRATDTADAELSQRLLKDMKWMSGARDRALRARQKEVAAIRLEIRNQVSREVMAQPVYQAWQFLTGKQNRIAPGTVATENVDTVQESGRLRTSLVKEMDEFSAETLKQRRMLSEKDGMHPDIVAELFGYPSGQDLIVALAAAESPNVEIDTITDQRMLEQHGDIASRQALERAAEEAIHNEVRARVIATELKALAKATSVRESSDSLYTGGTVDVMARAAREYAAQVVARQKLKDLRPAQYTAAEARSAKLAVESLGNTAEAAMHKRNQLVNNFAAKAAFEAQAEITQANEFFKKVMKGTGEKVSKTRDFGMVQAARAILAEYGIGTKGESALKYLDSVAQDDPGMHAVLRDKIDALTANAKPAGEMTVDEFRGLVEEIQGLWYMAKRSRQVEIDGQLLERSAIQNDLVTRLHEIGVPARVPGEGQAVTNAERNLTRLQTLQAALRRVESWVGVKDGTQAMGPFRRYIWQPVKEAADAYRADKAKYIKQYKQLLETVDLGKSRIAAPELGYTFGFSRGGSGKQEILHAILHTGNESNKRKLLLGRGWATENENTHEIDTSRWDAFVARMIAEKVLTKADFDFAQGVWDLLESTKALAQKAHRDVFGRYFDEVTATEFTNEFGTYRGGYVPAMMDSEVVKDQATRALQEDENQTMAYAFPSTSKGFTKARVEHNKPLLLDLRTLSSHIDKVLLFSHMEQPIRDVRKVLTSKDVSEPLHRIDPQAFDGLLTPWLNRAARQTIETKVPGDNGTMRFFSKLRQRAGLAAMFVNVSNAAQQITGFSLAAVKVRPKYLLSAMGNYLIAPRQMSKTVAESSVYMATRMDNEVAAMTDAIDQILLNPNVYEKAQNWTAKHAYFMQSAVDNVMGPIIWTGAYNQALEQGHSTKDAARLADSAIRETQGSTLAEDVSRIETGNAFVRMFTQFAGYFNMQANLLGTEFSKAYHELGLRKGMGRGLYVFILGYLVPNMMAELIAQAFKGGPDDEDKDGSTLDDWIKSVVILGNVKTSLAMVPGVGQLANAGIATFVTKTPADDRITTSPAISMAESAVVGNIKTIKQLIENGEVDNGRRAVRDLATLISLTTGLPASAIARPLGYAVGTSENKIAPTGPVDTVRGLVTGTPSPESKR
ncbi:hypothetical protein EJP67_18635 [Variovorax guangxiensis]|uniref:Large polyvalent protein associated domain-containing protein n=1 Tax=Variovorax guangxiensis TaxID=1775474 RepID=A0A433MML2_9BURK|nr:hypothetical protein [Variovorax guangxiensis]RUR69078.1 hypothetical protein EJP67_18635 [Variovorax guangxiensis]